MRILCVIDTFRIGGGAQTQLAGLAVMLKCRGHEVRALSYHDNAPEVSFEPYLTEHGVEYECLGGATGMYGKMAGVKRAVDRYAPDTVIAYIDGATAICCMLKAAGGRFRLIVSERNVTQRLNLKGWLKFQWYRFADAVVPNAYTQEGFIKGRFPFLANKVRTISNFVDTDVFRPRAEGVSRGGRLEILVVARIDPQKNIVRFLEALAMLDAEGLDFHVEWYGRFAREYYGECLAKRAELRLEERVSFHDAVKNVNAVYADARYDVYCLPSLFEGCPNTVGEAMASGLPVLCSDVCDNSKYVEQGVNGFLFDPRSSRDMAGAITAFAATDAVRRAEMGRNSRRMAAERLSKDAFLAKYLELI